MLVFYLAPGFGSPQFKNDPGNPLYFIINGVCWPGFWLYNACRTTCKVMNSIGWWDLNIKLVTALIHPAMNATTKYLTGSLGAILLLFLFMIFVIVLDRMWRRLPADSPAIYRVSIQDAA
jgi:hypothetical protein